MQFNPLVSIIIPVYNGSNYMCEAIDSALAQTYKNIEIIVVNDGSDDAGKTEEIARNYGNKIRYICKNNGGVSTALNTGIANMKGLYFSWLSHDDIYTPDKIEKEICALSRLANKDTIILCESGYIDENSDTISSFHTKKSVPEDKLIPWDAALMTLIKEGSFNGCSLLISKAIFEKCGTFDESLRFNQDGYMWNRIFLNRYPLFCISDVCVYGRIHSEQVTQKRQDLFHKDCTAMSEYLIPQFGNISTKNQNFLYEYIKYNAKYSNKSVVKKAMESANELNLLGFIPRMKILFICIWGAVRPTIRKVLYLVKYNIKSK